MTFLDAQAPIRRFWPAIAGGLALVLASAISLAGVNAFGAFYAFGFAPLLVILVWPRTAMSVLSIIIVFMGGLFTDWAVGGVLGQWALVLCMGWGLFRPELRDRPFEPVAIIVVWLTLCGLAMALLSLTGWIVYRVSPDVTALGRSFLATSALLPIVLLLRRVLASRLGGGENWDI